MSAGVVSVFHTFVGGAAMTTDSLTTKLLFMAGFIGAQLTLICSHGIEEMRHAVTMSPICRFLKLKSREAFSSKVLQRVRSCTNGIIRRPILRLTWSTFGRSIGI